MKKYSSYPKYNFILISYLSIFYFLCISTTEVKAQQNEKKFEEIKIGTLIWMKKNLDVVTYLNGDTIPQVENPNEWKNLTHGAWCYYDNDSENNENYGKLYNWYAVNDERGLAPKGWHIATISEWKKLINTFGGEQQAAPALRSLGKFENQSGLWYESKVSGNNLSCFSAIPCGSRHYGGNFGFIGVAAFWWTSTNNKCAYLYYDQSSILINSYDKRSAFSVRCVKDSK